MSSASRRDQILDAAQPLFAAQGFERTTTREIAAAAGVSDALLYRHFGSKADLLAAMVDRTIGVFGELPPLTTLRAIPFRPLLEQIGTLFVERALLNLETLIILLGDHRRVDDLRFVAFVDTAAASLGDLIAERVEHVDAAEGYLLARSYFGSLIAFVLLQRVLRMDEVRPVDAAAYVSATATPLAAYLEGSRS